MGKIDGQQGERSLTPLGEARSARDAAKQQLNVSPDVCEAARFIVSAWDALSRQAHPGEAHEFVAADNRFERESWLASLARVRALAEESDGRDRRDPVVLLELRDQLDWLSRAIASRARAPAAGANSRSWRERVRNPSPAGVAGVLGVVAVAALSLAALAGESGSPRPWRAAFYRNLDLADAETGPVIRHQPRLDFDWGRRSPVPGVGSDSFSVRWDSCLRVPEARTSAGELRFQFQLRSDDDARLWLDDRPLLAGWGGGRRGGQRAQAVEASLSPGLHHVRVEYRDFRGPASISLEIEAQGERANQRAGDGRGSAAGWLELPPEPFDSGDPCRLAGGGRAQ